jgi:hypothetical protein
MDMSRQRVAVALSLNAGARRAHIAFDTRSLLVQSEHAQLRDVRARNHVDAGARPRDLAVGQDGALDSIHGRGLVPRPALAALIRR